VTAKHDKRKKRLHIQCKPNMNSQADSTSWRYSCYLSLNIFYLLYVDHSLHRP